MSFGDGIDWNAEGRRAAAEDAARGTTGPGGVEAFERLRALLPEGAGLLDAGCNIGRYCPAALAAGFRYVGVDQAEEALQTARKLNPEGVFQTAFLWNMGFSGTFDAAICFAVLQHNTHAEKELILPRIAAALRPGGYFCMSESTVLTETATQLTREGWIALAVRHGFELVETWHPNPEHGIDDHYLFRKAAPKAPPTKRREER